MTAVRLIPVDAYMELGCGGLPVVVVARPEVYPRFFWSWGGDDVAFAVPAQVADPAGAYQVAT